MQRFRGEDGGTSIEHALLAALVALVCLFAFDALGPNLARLFDGAAIPKTSSTAPAKP